MTNGKGSQMADGRVDSVSIDARRAELDEVAHLREQFCREASCQIVRFTNLTRGFAHPVVFEHTVEPEGDWVVDVAGEVVAAGGHLTHYNHPYADIYMEVKQTDHR
jgi:hypothetical protein